MPTPLIPADDAQIPPTPNEPVDPEWQKFYERVGAVIMGAAIIITLFLVGMMATQLWNLNQTPKVEAITVLKEQLKTYKDLNADTVVRAYLEHDAQYLRTKRAQSLLSTKLFINALGIMSGILLMTMGSAFIMARIKTPKNNLEVGGFRTTGVEAIDTEAVKKRPYLVFASYSPGLFFALFGTVLICVSLDKSASGQVETYDGPVFLQEYNVKTQSAENSDKGLVVNGKYEPDNKCAVLGNINTTYCKESE